MVPLDKINVKMNYTFGKDYGARSMYNITAAGAGSFTIKYIPHYDMAGKGFINFTVENTDAALGVIKDFSIDHTSGPGLLYVSIPAAGNYQLSIISKYKTSADLVITTNGNYFYKTGPFLGNGVENYRGDLLSLPGYFYVPQGMDKLYFSVSNGNPGGAGFATAAEIGKAFMFMDQNSQLVTPKLAAGRDSALFYLEIPVHAGGTFWRAFKSENLLLCFANTSNFQWYARKKTCTAADFKAVVTEDCITQLNATAGGSINEWSVYDSYKWFNFTNSQQVTLPENVSPNAIVYFTSNQCMITRRLADDAAYLRQKTACATGALVPEPTMKTVLYPNPGTGLIKIVQNSDPVLATEVVLINAGGTLVARFTNTQQFNIGGLVPGSYLYQIVVNGTRFTGKLIKI